MNDDDRAKRSAGDRAFPEHSAGGKQHRIRECEITRPARSIHDEDGRNRQIDDGKRAIPAELRVQKRRSQTCGPERQRKRVLVGDLIVGFDGTPINDPEDLVGRLRGDRVGAAVPVTVIRGTTATDVTVTVAERPTTRG